MFTSDRVFFQRNLETGLFEWFFQAREGAMGPYVTKGKAQLMLREFVAHCIEMGDDGGRCKKAHGSTPLTLIPLSD